MTAHDSKDVRRPAPGSSGSSRTDPNPNPYEKHGPNPFGAPPKAIQVASTRLGDLQVSTDDLVHIPDGMLGLEGMSRYVRVPGEGPFQWLQSVQDPDVTFLMVDAQQVAPGYALDTEAVGLERLLEDDPAASLVLLLVVNVADGDDGPLTANLEAPLVVNTHRQVAAQVIQPCGFTVAHPIYAADQAVVTGGVTDSAPGVR